VIFAPAAAAPVLFVRDFGAKGDSTTDDTAAFQKAMDQCAKEGGGVVSVPTGKYLIKTHLNVPPAVTLEGVWRAPATVQRYRSVESDPASPPELTGSVLLAVEGAGSEDGTPFIMLNTNSTLKGITVFYPNQTRANPPVAYPWAVASAGADNPSIVDVLLVNPYQGVDFGTRVAGRHFIRNLYGQPLRRGLFVDVCLDVGRIENVHFWPFWSVSSGGGTGEFVKEKGEAFIFGRSDWEYVTNCFAISYNVGMRFVGGKQGGGNYLLTQSGADCCPIAVLVEETQGHSGVSFSNSQIFGDIVVKDTNNGMVRFTGCGLFGTQDGRNGVGVARIAGRGRVSFDNCHFYAIVRNFKADNLIRVDSGRVSITDSLFINGWDATYNNKPIYLGPDVISAIISNNEFYGKSTVENHAKGRVVIENNIGETETNPFPAPSP
jgi:hypothetical protein